jgi:hypothetical protein
MKITSLLLFLLINFNTKAQLKTVADFKNNVICNYHYTKPFMENTRTNIHAGNASLSCVKVTNITTQTDNISNSPIKIDIQKNNGLICYSINTPAFRDDRRGHLHGGHSALSCIKK